MKKMIEAIIETLKQILGMIDEKEPDRPNKKYTEPEFVVVKGVKFKTHGVYKTSSGQAEGLIVHYTVSNRSRSSAIGVLKYLARKGLGCMVMDEDGIIYVAENVNIFKSVAWHAGTSRWKGKTGLSRYCMGIEICNWGKLDSRTKKLVPKPRKSINKDNIKAGDYQPYTKEQELSLTNLVLWCLENNSEFKIDMVLGHDEIAPSRKSDPGASLSMSMPKFRTYMKGLVKK